jgi:tetratricopeptide (TPR) repeat protein
LLAILAGSVPTHADDFEDGLKAYHESQYAESTAAFERSLALSESAAAHHNLALSLFQQGKPSEAAWQLESAVRLAPTNQSYHYKLSALRQQLGLYKLPSTWWQSASNILSQRTWVWIASISFWIIAAAIALPSIAGFRRPILIKLTLSFASIAFALGSAALIIRSTQQASGIVISGEPTTLHYAPASAAPEAGIARPGERGRVLDQHNQFLKIKTEADITGWISKEAFREL